MFVGYSIQNMRFNHFLRLLPSFKNMIFFFFFGVFPLGVFSSNVFFIWLFDDFVHKIIRRKEKKNNHDDLLTSAAILFKCDYLNMIIELLIWRWQIGYKLESIYRLCGQYGTFSLYIILYVHITFHMTDTHIKYQHKGTYWFWSLKFWGIFDFLFFAV